MAVSGAQPKSNIDASCLCNNRRQYVSLTPDSSARDSRVSFAQSLIRQTSEFFLTLPAPPIPSTDLTSLQTILLSTGSTHPCPMFKPSSPLTGGISLPTLTRRAATTSQSLPARMILISHLDYHDSRLTAVQLRCAAAGDPQAASPVHRGHSLRSQAPGVVAILRLS
jgi:hypothetical protein